MTGGYNKLFSSIVTSTVWCAPDRHRLVWITMLAMADQRGVIDASLPGLAKIAGVPIADCEAAINAFLGPDPYSRSEEFDGQRVEEFREGVVSGWRLLNHGKYRAARGDDARREYNRNWMAGKRAKEKDDGVDVSVENSGACGQMLAQAEADTDTEAKSSKSKAKAGARSEKRGTRLPLDWEPSDEAKIYAKAHQVDWKVELESFKDWWAAAAGTKGVKLDWQATWRTWVRRATKTLSAPSTGPQGAKAALAPSESKLERDMAYIRNQQHLGAITFDEMKAQLMACKAKYPSP